MHENDLLIVDVWKAIRARLLTVISTALLFGAFAGIAAFLMTPVYRATVLVAPVVDQDAKSSIGGLLNQFGGLASMAGISLGTGTTNRDEAIAILKSRAFTVRFISERELLPILFADHWDRHSSKWILKAKAPDFSDGYRVFSEIRSISEDRQTGFVELAVEWTDPQLAADWANGLIENVNAVMRTTAIADAERGIEYLERELAKTSVVELRQAIFGLIEGQINRIMLANVRGEYAFKILDRAVASDADEFERPRRLLMIVMGLLIGGLAGVGLAFSIYVRHCKT